MPSSYKHTSRGKTMNYSTEQLEQSVNSVRSGQLSIRKASAMFNIPKSTIGDRISGKHELLVQHGRPPCIPIEAERKIVSSVKAAAQRGIGLTRRQLLLRTHTLCQRVAIANPSYKNFKAGKNWFEGLKRRHNLSIRKPERLGSVRARMLNEAVVSNYYNDLASLVDNLQLREKPKLIWNCDETGKNFEHDPVKIITEKGARSVVSKTSNKSSNITIMACVNASGDKMPPMLVVKGKTSRCLHSFNIRAAPEGTQWTYQANGWMTDEIGEKWFNNVFLAHCGPERPQLLILDGHSSHESLAILERAMEENIEILSLPPHTTHYLQPLDRSVFGPFNRAYNSKCAEFLQSNPLHLINKWTFPAILAEAWDQGVSAENIKAGFKACGIFPLNSSVLPRSVFAPSVPTDVVVPIQVPSTEPVDQSLEPSSTELVVPLETVPIIPEDHPLASPSTYPVVHTLVTPSIDPTVHPLASSSADPVLQPLASPSTDPIVQPLLSTSTDAIVCPLASSSTDLSVQALLSPSKDPIILPLAPPSTELVIHSDSSGIPEPLVIHESGELNLSPSEILNMITNGEFIIESSTDHDLVPELKICEPKTESSQVPEFVPVANWNEEIDAMFLPPNITNKRPSASTRKSVTSHRLLTSDDVLAEKRKMEEKKRANFEKSEKRKAKKIKT